MLTNPKKIESQIEKTNANTVNNYHSQDFALLHSPAYQDHLARVTEQSSKKDDSLKSDSGSSTPKQKLQSRESHIQKEYQGIFPDSQLILPRTPESSVSARRTDDLDKDRKIAQEIREEDRKTGKDKSTYPITDLVHVVPQFMGDNWVLALSEDQAEEVDRSLIPGFSQMDPPERAKQILSLSSNICLGPPDGERVSVTKGYRLEALSIKKSSTSTNIYDFRPTLYCNIESIMLARGRLIKQGRRSTKEMLYEEFKMSLLCFIAAEEFHGKVNSRGKGKLDPYYTDFYIINEKWNLSYKRLLREDFNNHLKIADEMECTKNIIWIKRFYPEHLANHFLQLEGEFSNYYDKSIRWRGGLSLDQITTWTDAVIKRFKELETNKYNQKEHITIAEVMREYVQRNKQEIAKIAEGMPDEDILKGSIAKLADMTDKDIVSMDNEYFVRLYTRVYLDRYARPDPEALADAFAGWEAKYNMWIEESLVESGGYSEQTAVDIAKAIGQKPPSELQKLAESIRKYMGKAYTDDAAYALNYARLFTKMESTARLYVQEADTFFETGQLPESVPQQEAAQLLRAIQIRAGIINAIGGSYEKQQLESRREYIWQNHAKKPLDYVRDTLRERIRAEETPKPPAISAERDMASPPEPDPLKPEQIASHQTEEPQMRDAQNKVVEDFKTYIADTNNKVLEKFKAYIADTNNKVLEKFKTEMVNDHHE